MGINTVADVGEDGLVQYIQRYVSGDARVVVGIGDDAALVQAIAPAAVLTTDMLVEDIDFKFAWATWADVGHKAAAVNLSDLAAMGARPRGLLLSLALRPHDHVLDVMRLVSTLAKVGARYGAPLVGGDLSKIGGPVVVSVTAIGEVDPKRALRRYGGELGDVIMVSGTLGAAAVGLAALQQGMRRSRVAQRLLRPQPQVELGMAFAQADIIKSAADISDGLARDAYHVVKRGYGIAFDYDALPIAASTRRLAAKLRGDPVKLAVEGGEDFELVVAVARKDIEAAQELAARHGTTLTVVGEVTRARGNTRVYQAFDHFRTA